MADYTSKQNLNNISRKRAFADMLRQQGQQLSQGLGETQMVSGRAVPNSGWASANAIISQLLGAYMGKKAGQQEDEAKATQRQELQDWAKVLQEAQAERGKTVEDFRGEMIDPVQVGLGPSPERVSPEVQDRVAMTNQAAQADIAQNDMDALGMPAQAKNAYMEALLSGQDIGGIAEKLAMAGLQREVLPERQVLGRGAQLIEGDRVVAENPYVEGGSATTWKPLPSTPGVFYRQGTDGVQMARQTENGFEPISSDEAQRIAEEQKLASSGGVPVDPKTGRRLGPMEIADREYYGENTNKLLPTMKRKMQTGEQALRLIGKIPEENFQNVGKFILEFGRDGWAEKILEATFLNDEERQLAATLKRMALAMREPGSGQISDFEQKIFQSAAGDQAGWSREALIGNMENAFIEPNMDTYNDLVDGWNRYAGDEAQKERYEYNRNDYIRPPKSEVNRKVSPDGTRMVIFYSDGTTEEMDNPNQ